MKKLIYFQFGNCYQRRAAGYRLATGVYHNPYYLWEKLVWDGAHLNVDEPLLEGFIRYNKPSEFWIGLSEGVYRITIIGYDPMNSHGPFCVRADGVEMLSGCMIEPNEILEQTFECRPKDGILKIQFVPQEGKTFLVNGLKIDGPEGAKLIPIFKTAPAGEFPMTEELLKDSEDTPRETLRKICDWCLAHQEPDGFAGDTTTYYTSFPLGFWYTASFPLRTLLAGYDILGDRKYLEAALRGLDLLVDEQLPNGGFMCVVRHKPTAALSEAEVNHLMTHDRQPMSDIGSMVSALAVGSFYADPLRKRRYIDSLRLFCDKWAIRFQQPSGTFSDGFSGGVYETETYTCATTIEAAAFSLVHKVTGNARYQAVADKAIRSLLPDWREDGRMLGRAPHWPVRNHLPFIFETLYFGDQYYYDEGFITTGYHTQDAELREKIHGIIRCRVFGACGLLTALGDRAWWPVEETNTWIKAKSAGMPQTLLYAKVLGKTTSELETALDRMRKFLCIPKYAQRLGVLVEDAERPAAVHGYNTWSGMQTEATGFAGMTIAEMIKPGVIYLS